jgi:hypothetical protein
VQHWIHGDCRPTALYLWTNSWDENMETLRNNPGRRYRQYVDNFDLLSHYQVMTTNVIELQILCSSVGQAQYLTFLYNFQVTWMPWARVDLPAYLSPRVIYDADEWLCNIGLIFFHVVEMHYPIRVQRQFGRLQMLPPPHFSTNPQLHK